MRVKRGMQREQTKQLLVVRKRQVDARIAASMRLMWSQLTPEERAKRIKAMHR